MPQPSSVDDAIAVVHGGGRSSTSTVGGGESAMSGQRLSPLSEDRAGRWGSGICAC